MSFWHVLPKKREESGIGNDIGQGIGESETVSAYPYAPTSLDVYSFTVIPLSHSTSPWWAECMR